MNPFSMLIFGVLAQDDAIAPPATKEPADVSPAPSPAGPDDREILAALLLLLDERTALEGVNRLGALADPRVIAPLAHAARTREVPVARAAIRSLARHPEAVAPLAAILGSKRPAEVEVEVARALGAMGTDAAADALIASLDRDLARAVRVEIVTTLRTHYPARIGGLDVLVARDGRPWLIVGGAWGLGFTLSAAGHFGKADLEGLGAVTGGLAGGSLGYASGRFWPMEDGDASFLATNGFVGTLGGLLVGAALAPDGSEDPAWLGGLAGEIVGYGVGIGFRKIHPGRASDAWESLMLSGAVGLGAGTLADFLVVGESDAPRLVTGLGYLGGMAAGDLFAPKVDLSFRDAGMMGLSSLYGLMVGSMVPLGSFSREGLPATGLSAGLIGAYALAPAVEMPWDVTFGGLAGLGYGALAGLGVGILVNEQDEDLVSGSALAGTTLGLGAGIALAARNPNGVRGNDVVLSAATTGWAAWQIVGWSVVYPDAPRNLGGLIPLVPAVTGIATSVASPWLDIGVDRSLPVVSLGLWGAYAGATLGVLTDAKEPLAWSLVASDLGLAGGALLMSPQVDASPVVVGMADAGGVLGASAGALSAAFATQDQDPILIASLVGAGVGALGGTGLGLVIERHRGGRRASTDLRLLPDLPDLPGRWSLLPTALVVDQERAWGARLDVSAW